VIYKLFSLSNIRLPLFLFSVWVSIFYPSAVNLAVVGLYCFFFVRSKIVWMTKPHITGVVKDYRRRTVPNAIIRLGLTDANQLQSLVVSNKKGKFFITAPLGQYQIAVTKQGYIWKRAEAGMSFQGIEVDKKNPLMKVTLVPYEVFMSGKYD